MKIHNAYFAKYKTAIEQNDGVYKKCSQYLFIEGICLMNIIYNKSICKHDMRSKYTLNILLVCWRDDVISDMYSKFHVLIFLSVRDYINNAFYDVWNSSEQPEKQNQL